MKKVYMVGIYEHGIKYFHLYKYKKHARKHLLLLKNNIIKSYKQNAIILHNKKMSNKFWKLAENLENNSIAQWHLYVDTYPFFSEQKIVEKIK